MSGVRPWQPTCASSIDLSEWRKASRWASVRKRGAKPEMALNVMICFAWAGARRRRGQRLKGRGRRDASASAGIHAGPSSG